MYFKEKNILLAAVILYLAVVGTVVSLRHYNFQTQAWDLGIFAQTMWNTVHGRWLENSLEFTQNHLATHMSPFLFLLAPGYAVFPSPYFLLIIQTLALGLGAWPLYLTARKMLKTKYLALILSLGYLLYPSLHWINLFDFHPIAFLVPLMLAAFYFLEERNWLWFGIFLALAASVQEEAIISVGFAGLYLLFFRKEKKVGFWVLFTSAIYFLLSTKLIMPALGGGLLRLDRYSQLGGNLAEIAQNIVLRPSLVWQTVIASQKFIYLFWLFLPVLFLPLRARQELILLIPGLAQNLLTLYTPQFSSLQQYDSVIIAGLFFSSVHALFNLEKTKIVRKIPIALAGVIMLIFLLRSPFSPFNFPTELFRINPVWNNLREISQMVPEKISVAAPTQLVPHLTNREKIFMLGQETERPDLVIMDGADYFGFPSPEAFAEYAQKYADSGLYETSVLANRYYILFKKNLSSKSQ